MNEAVTQLDEVRAIRPSASRIERYHVMMAWLISGILLSDILLAPIVHLYGLQELLSCLPCALALAGIGCYCHWRKLSRFKEVSILALWAVLATNALSALIQVGARTSARFIDASLADYDYRIGISTGGVVAWISRFPLLRLMLEGSYELVVVLILASLFLPTLMGYQNDSRRYAAGVVISGVITAAIFASLPALGPWAIYRFAPTKAQVAYVSYLNLLRSGRPVQMNLASSGIVTFPSFHVVLAILSAIALWNVRSVRWPAVLLSAAVCASTITTGWHYLTDVIAGATLAVMSTAIARWTVVER